MDSEQRREAIIETLKSKQRPIKGSEFSKMFNVTRQVIVQDIAILRAKGEEIFATPQGYMIVSQATKEEILKTIMCKHKGYGEIEDELKTVDLGKIIDVIVNHPVYSKIKIPLMLSSRAEIDEFVNNLKEKCRTTIISTDGIHIHTIEVPNLKIYERILIELEKRAK